MSPSRWFTAFTVSTTACAALTAPSSGQVIQDDLIIGVNSNQNDSLRWVRGGNPSGTTPLTGASVTPRPWQYAAFQQSVEFDNANNVSHNAQGNLLTTNFGNAFTGFEVWQAATNGTGDATKVWSIKSLTGSARTDRGGGLSVSPDNSKVAWTNYDRGSVYVMDYSGGNVGAGTGAVIDGERETGFNELGLSAIASGVTQGSTWLDSNTVLAFSGFGELVEIDASVSGGDASTPSEMLSTTVKSGVFAGSPQFTSIVYNPDVSNYIYGAAGFFSGSTTNKVYVWDTDYNLVAEADVSNVQTAREISLDKEGNLYVGGFGQDIVAVIPNAKDPANVTNNSAVPYWQNDFFASYSGLDVASSIKLGDVVRDNVVRANDIDALFAQRAAYAATGAKAPRTDLNRDFQVTQADVDVLVRDVLATAYGDANLDRRVNAFDANALRANLGASSTGTWAQGDFTGDRNVNAFDANILRSNLGFDGTAATLESSGLNIDAEEPNPAKALALIANAEGDGITDFLYNPDTGELFVNDDGEEPWALVFNTVVDPLSTSPPTGWQFINEATNFQFLDRAFGGNPLDSGLDTLLALLPTGLTAADFGQVQYFITADFDEHVGTVGIVPEPASLALLGTGIVLMAKSRRRAA